MKKVYKTKTKTHILAFLKENPNLQFNAYEIHNALLKNGIELNLATVYRALDTLVQTEDVLKFISSDGKNSNFQFNDKEKNCIHHLHVQCSNCGTISHLDCTTSEVFLEHVLKHHQLKINCDSSMLFGICEKCANKDKKNNN